MGNADDPRESSLKLIAGTIMAVLLGLVFLVTGYFIGDSRSPKYSLFWSFICTNIGALLVFSGGYTLLSELYLKRSFIREIRKSVLKGELDRSIVDLGLSEITSFSAGDLNKILVDSSTVKMIVMRSDSFFSANYEKLRSGINKRGLSLTVLLPNPNNSNLMEVLYTRFSNFRTASQLAESIVNVVEVWLRKQIYDQLETDDARLRLVVRVSDRYPLYSAYLFDDRELWYIPYHARNDTQQIPVFIFRDRKVIAGLEIHKDISDLMQSASVVDLSQKLEQVVPGKKS